MKYDIWNQLGIHRFCFVQCILLLDHDVPYMCGLIGAKHAVIEHYGGGSPDEQLSPSICEDIFGVLGHPFAKLLQRQPPKLKAQ